MTLLMGINGADLLSGGLIAMVALVVYVAATGAQRLNRDDEQ